MRKFGTGKCEKLMMIIKVFCVLRPTTTTFFVSTFDAMTRRSARRDENLIYGHIKCLNKNKRSKKMATEEIIMTNRSICAELRLLRWFFFTVSLGPFG